MSIINSYKRSFNRINNIKTSKTELIERHWLQNNTYNIIFVATVLFLSSLFCWSGRSETFLLWLWWYTTLYIRLNIFLFLFSFSKTFECRFAIDAMRSDYYNFIMKCFEFSNWLYIKCLVQCVCFGYMHTDFSLASIKLMLFCTLKTKH